MVQVIGLGLGAVSLIIPEVFHDHRGYFMEAYCYHKYCEAGLPTEFTQDNHSHSVKNVIRGLHFQLKPGQVKLVRVVSGEIWDVVVDINPRSPTFGKWIAETLSSDNHKQMLVPIGFAHGFCVLSEQADVIYKVNVPYNPEAEKSIYFDDPTLNITWPTEYPIISKRDSCAMSFLDYIKQSRI